MLTETAAVADHFFGLVTNLHCICIDKLGGSSSACLKCMKPECQ